MSDKFSLYQTDGLWGIIENTSNEKQTSIKSYFGSDLIIKRLNEQAEQIDQLKQQLEIQSSVLKQTREKLSKAEHDRDRYRDKIKEQQEQLAKKENMHPLDEKLFQHYCAYKHIEPEIKGCLDRDREREYIKQLTEKQKTIDEINKEFVQSVHDWKALCAEKDEEIERLKSGIVKECKEHQDFIKEAKQITNQLKSNYQTQLAIQELEKTLNFIEDVFDKALKNCSLNNVYYDQILDFIDQQINELKGEK